jgi:acyl-CoA thioester hydrolase
MIHREKKYLASTIEFLSLYVDLDKRKVIEFEDEKILIMDKYIFDNYKNFNNNDLKFSTKLKK